MPTADGTIYRRGTPNVLVATVDAVLGFEGQRESRTVTTPIPAGGNAMVIRPHGPRQGTFRFAFVGATAQTRAEALEASLATGSPHYLSGTPGGTAGFFFTATGNLSFERVHDVRGAVWIVTADWSAT